MKLFKHAEWRLGAHDAQLMRLAALAERYFKKML